MPRLASSRASDFVRPINPALLAAVIRLTRVADQSDDRADVDDPTAPLLDHRPHQGLHKIERAFQVRVQDRVPIFNRHPHAQSVARDAGVVHQNVDATEVFQNLCADFLHGGMIGDIDGIGLRRIRARRIDFVGGFLRVGFGAADGSDARAFTGQTHGDGMPNSPPRSCDHRDLIFESHKARDDRLRHRGEQSSRSGAVFELSLQGAAVCKPPAQ